MKLYVQYKLRRLALNMTQKEFAATVAKVDEGVYSVFERGDMIDKISYTTIKENVYSYIRNVIGKNKEEYLIHNIVYEALSLRVEDESEHTKTAVHIGLHANKLAMMYVGTKEDF